MQCSVTRHSAVSRAAGLIRVHHGQGAGCVGLLVVRIAAGMRALGCTCIGPRCVAAAPTCTCGAVPPCRAAAHVRAA